MYMRSLKFIMHRSKFFFKVEHVLLLFCRSEGMDDVKVPWKQRRLPSFIALDKSSESSFSSVSNTTIDSPAETPLNLLSIGYLQRILYII